MNTNKKSIINVSVIVAVLLGLALLSRLLIMEIADAEKKVNEQNAKAEKEEQAIRKKEKELEAKRLVLAKKANINLVSLEEEITQPIIEISQEVQAIANKLPENLNYNLDVRPILSDKCFHCHGPDKSKQKANLFLHKPEGAFRELVQTPDRYAIVPSNIKKSELVKRILSYDENTIMPTPESGLSLSDLEKATLIKWINQGAKYEKHWAYIPLSKTEIPKVKNEVLVNNPIDNFIVKKLEKYSMRPSEKANKSTLLRRIYLDLTGLPPTVEELDVFLTDNSPNAYEKVIDRLLASAHYGERMAKDWLDVSRYADSDGYQDDEIRTSWPWRDWVIKSFNKNQRFDEFLHWQLAGDMMENPTKEMILATSYNRNHMQNVEAGIIEEEYRIEYVADRTNTIGKSLLGLTMECARCHDHKFDEISQKEYFQLFAFFNSMEERGKVPYIDVVKPYKDFPTDEQEIKIDEIKRMINKLNQNKIEEQIDQEYQAWLKNTDKKIKPRPEKTIAYYDFEPVDSSSVIDSAIFSWFLEKKKGDELVIVPHDSMGYVFDSTRSSWVLHSKGKKNNRIDSLVGYHDNQDPFSISFWIKSEENNKMNFNYINEFFYKKFIFRLVNNNLEVEMRHTDEDRILVHARVNVEDYNNWTHVAMTYDGSGMADGINVYFNETPLKLNVKSNTLTKSMLRVTDDRGIQQIKSKNINRVRESRKTELRTFKDGVFIDDFVVVKSELSHLDIIALKTSNSDTINTLLANERTVQEDQKLKEYFVLNYSKVYQKRAKELHALRSQKIAVMDKVPEVMISKELIKPRETFILDRGAYDAPTTKVEPDVVQAVLPFPKEFPKNRLGLAKWLTHPENPLVSRVLVNRFWQQFFGKGIVATVDDFGNQGELPTHMELLNWLSKDFMDSGWNVKKLVKKIVMSSTYQQKSVSNMQLNLTDPKNKLYARGPSYRLSAEQIRDNILASSGLLVNKIGGKSVYPYQPKGMWKAISPTDRSPRYWQGTGEDLYRRSMYTIWRRSTPPATMVAFNAPNREVCTVDRQKTNTPIQALILMNDPQYVEAARVLAEDVLNRHKDPREAISLAYRQVSSTVPNEKSVERLYELYQNERKKYSLDVEKAKKMLAVGETKYDGSLDPVDLAGMFIVTNTLFNHDRVVYKR